MSRQLQRDGSAQKDSTAGIACDGDKSDRPLGTATAGAYPLSFTFRTPLMRAIPHSHALRTLDELRRSNAQEPPGRIFQGTRPP
jgi:hypothetical protein